MDVDTAENAVQMSGLILEVLNNKALKKYEIEFANEHIHEKLQKLKVKLLLGKKPEANES